MYAQNSGSQSKATPKDLLKNLTLNVIQYPEALIQTDLNARFLEISEKFLTWCWESRELPVNDKDGQKMNYKGSFIEKQGRVYCKQLSYQLIQLNKIATRLLFNNPAWVRNDEVVQGEGVQYKIPDEFFSSNRIGFLTLPQLKKALDSNPFHQALLVTDGQLPFSNWILEDVQIQVEEDLVWIQDSFGKFSWSFRLTDGQSLRPAEDFVGGRWDLQMAFYQGLPCVERILPKVEGWEQIGFSELSQALMPEDRIQDTADFSFKMTQLAAAFFDGGSLCFSSAGPGLPIYDGINQALKAAFVREEDQSYSKKTYSLLSQCVRLTKDCLIYDAQTEYQGVEKPDETGKITLLPRKAHQQKEEPVDLDQDWVKILLSLPEFIEKEELELLLRERDFEGIARKISTVTNNPGQYSLSRDERGVLVLQSTIMRKRIKVNPKNK